MKKVLVFALAVAALASCAKSEVSSLVDVTSQGAMKFTAYSNESVVTRGVDADNTTIATNGNAIGVYAYGATDLVVDASLSNHKIVSNNGAWESIVPAYWKPNTTYNFYAYFPYVSAVATTDTQIITDFTQVPYSADNQQDILYTGVISRTTGDQITNLPAVALTFKHATSKADFKISVADDCTLTINSLRIEGLSSAHTGLALADGFANTVVADCSQSGARAYYYGSAQNFDSAITVTKDAAVSLSAATSAGAFYLLPQFITPWSIDAEDVVGSVQGARVVINYTLTDSVGTVIVPESGAGTQNAAFPIPVIKDSVSGDVIGLQEGKSYIFTLTFAENKSGGYEPEFPFPEVNPEEMGDEIKFEVSVNPWIDYTIEIPLN